jgi:hypothetical protein
MLQAGGQLAPTEATHQQLLRLPSILTLYFGPDRDGRWRPKC